MKAKHYLIAAVVLVAAFLGWHYFVTRESAEQKFASNMAPEMERMSKEYGKEAQEEARRTGKPLYCPGVGTLHREKDKWYSADGKWTNYNPSSAKNVVNFQGAQWVGVKVGKIICLYKTDEEVPFPLALEYAAAREVFEPNGGGWSALVKGNRKFCKSANIADCEFYTRKPKKMKDVYKEIEYNPAPNNSI